MRTFLFPRWDMLGSRKVYAWKDPTPNKNGTTTGGLYLYPSKKRGCATTVSCWFFPIFYKLYTFYQENTLKRNDTSTLTSPLPPFRIFWAIQHNNKTMSLVVEKTKKNAISTIRIGSMGLVYLLYIHHVPWGWCIDVLWVHFYAKLVGI